jgi:GTP-binding protein Era
MTGNPGAYRCGTIGMAGRPNTGKSSLLNRLIGEKVSIVSPKPQTTRHLVTGILTRADAQYIFVDAPGQPPSAKSLLHRALSRRASEAARDADVALFVVEAPRFGPEDRAVLERIPPQQKVVAVVNKVDRLKSSAELLPFLERLSKAREFQAIVPVSAQTGKNLGRLLDAVRELLPEGPAAYPADQFTDRDERFLAGELLREKLFREMGEELPYRCEVLVESFKQEGALRRIEALILVERDSQKGIVLGKGGERLKRMASAARKDMERLFGGKVYLGVWVKVRRAWTDDRRVLKELGY